MINELMKQYRKIPIEAKASIWFTFSSILLRGISFITVPIFTRMMSTQEYGQVTEYTSWYNLFYYLCTLNLAGGGTAKGLIKYSNDKERFISSLQGLTTVIVVLWGIIFLAGHKTFSELLKLPFFIIAILWLELLTVPSKDLWMIQMRFNYKYIEMAFVAIGVAVITPIIGYIAVIFSVEKGIGRIISIGVVNTCVGLMFYIRNMTKGNAFFVKEYWLYALRFNIPLIPHYLSMIILDQSDRIMIGKFFGTTQVAIYGVAYSISVVMSLVATSINASFIPWTYQMCAEEKYHEIGKVANIMLVIVAVFSLVPVVFAPEVITIMAPADYREAIWIIPPIATSVYFIFLYGLFGNIEFYFEKTKLIMIASTSGAAINIVLNYIFMPIFGYIVAGYTTMVCYMLFAVIHYVFMRKVCKENLEGNTVYDMKSIIALTGVYLITVVVIMLFYNKIWIRYGLIVVVLIVAVCYRKRILQIFKNLKEK